MIQSKLKVLYVEDDDTSRLLLRELLDDGLGIEARTANSVREALELLQIHDFDILILDWWLQDPDTLENLTSETIIRWLIDNKYKAMPVVFTSDKVFAEQAMIFGVPILRKDHKDFLMGKVREAVEAKKSIATALGNIRDTLKRMTDNGNQHI